MNRVKDKVVIVTGGSVGIGRAACILLASEGAKVAITDIDEVEGKKLAVEIHQNKGCAEFWPMDVSKENDVLTTFQSIENKFGRIDVLVNNAGIAGSNQPTDLMTEEEWDSVNAINVKGVFFCTKHAIPYMRKQHGGSIINISSIYGLVGAPDLPAYHASKGAVTLMTKTDAMLFASDKIRVNSIHPGYIWTPLVAKLARKAGGGKKAFLERVGALHPLGHVGEPNDVGYGVVYLASDESKFITGSELVIDGGYTAR